MPGSRAGGTSRVLVIPGRADSMMTRLMAGPRLRKVDLHVPLELLPVPQSPAPDLSHAEEADAVRRRQRCPRTAADRRLRDPCSRRRQEHWLASVAEGNSFVAGREIGLLELVGQAYGIVGRYYQHLGNPEGRRDMTPFNYLAAAAFVPLCIAGLRWRCSWRAGS